MNEGPTEQDIVLGLRNGDRTAWNSLCLRYSESLWRYVARLVGSNREAVADVYQETMLGVARSGRNLDVKQTRLWPWLVSIAHNQTALYWRKRYRDGHSTDSVALADSRSDTDPVVVAARAETVDGVRRILAEMAAADAAVLTAKYLDDQSVAEIVESTGSTTEAVRSRLARARRDFRDRYERLNGRVESQPEESTAGER